MAPGTSFGLVWTNRGQTLGCAGPIGSFWEAAASCHSLEEHASPKTIRVFLVWNVLIVSKGSLLDLFKNAQGKILLSVDVWTAAHGKKKVGFLQFLIYFSFLCKLHKRWQTMCAFLYSPAHSHSNKLTGLSPSYRWVKSHGTKIIIFKQFEVHFFRGLPLPSPSKI